MLTVSGERKAEHEERKEGYYRVERSFGRFSRSLTLPEGVDADAVKRELRAAACSRSASRSPRQRKPRKVAIVASARQPKTIEGSETETTAAA